MKSFTMPKIENFNIHVAKQQEIERDPLEKHFSKKVLQCRKKLKGGTR